MRKLKSYLPILLGSFFIVIIIFFTLIGYGYTPHDPTDMQVMNRFSVPSSTNLFGTDQYGRDLFSRVMVGGQTSLSIALVAVSSGLIIGVSFGAIAGYRRGLWDEILMRIAEVGYSFPSFLLALIAVTIWGSGKATIMGAISVANIPIFIKITRANVLYLREMNYVEAARAAGASDLRIILTHILPNSIQPILVQATASFAGAILAEASLSYLGLGVQPPQPSWGRMLRDAQAFAGLAPWTVIFPGLAIALTVLGLNLLGDGLKIKGNNYS